MPQKIADTETLQSSSGSSDWLWKTALKWYFFPLLYIFLAVVFSFIASIAESGGYYNSDFEELGGIFLMTLYFLPNGLFFFVQELQKFGEEGLYIIFPAVFHVFWIVMAVILQYFKYRKNKTLRWIIITLTILMVLSFAGCTSMVLSEGFGDFGF